MNYKLELDKEKIKTYDKIKSSTNGGVVVNISPSFCQTFTELLNQINQYDQEIEPDLLAREAYIKLSKNMQNLFPALLDKISHFTNSASPPYLLLRKFIDVRNIPDTPIYDMPPPTNTWRTVAGALLGVLLLSGYHAASFQDEMDGRLAHMVMPAKNNQESYIRSTKQLDFHTEVLDGYFHEEVLEVGLPLSPEIIGLICLRNIEGLITTILPLNVLLQHLSLNTIATLMQPIFTTSSQSYSSRKVINKNVPLIKKLDKGYLGIRYNHHRLVANTQAGKKALAELISLVDNSSHVEEIILQPGDILLINNRTCLHGRESLASSAKFNGLDRWLIRMYGYSADSLSKIKKEPLRKHVMVID